jgi:ankyrin repeat protein
MLQPIELKKDLPVVLSNGILSSTGKVWEILKASKEGKLEKVRALVNECPALAYAQYNYAPPVHFAVREGHTELVSYLLGLGAHDPLYKIYPFQESLQTIAGDRGFSHIVSQLNEYAGIPAAQQYKGDNGAIQYNRTAAEKQFEKAVAKEDIERTEQILKEHPEFALDETFFWSEGILLFAAKENNRRMIDLLMSYGATVPAVLKWTQFYYFEKMDAATYMMEKGMNPNVQSWHHVTLLHDMAQKGDIAKAALLIKYGADLNRVDEEYQSTPLGMAARWGYAEMVNFLLKQGADPGKSGAEWSTPQAWAVKKGHREIEKILLKAR